MLRAERSLFILFIWKISASRDFNPNRVQHPKFHLCERETVSIRETISLGDKVCLERPLTRHASNLVVAFTVVVVDINFVQTFSTSWAHSIYNNQKCDFLNSGEKETQSSFNRRNSMVQHLSQSLQRNFYSKGVGGHATLNDEQFRSCKYNV